jgi:tetratricopeptide (TPR) repeat protein
MFEELKRLFATDAPPRDGLTGGDASLLDVLDLGLLRSEARSADIAAGRIGAKDPHQRRLEAARVWRELARRTGDPVALRNAALGAEKAVQGFKAEGRVKAWAAARCEQAMSAMLGADLYGDEGLNAAAELALKDAVAAAPSGACAAIAGGQLARLAALPLFDAGTGDQVRQAAAAFDSPIAVLATHLRSKAVSKALLAELRCERAELLMAAGLRLSDPRLYEAAIAELDKLTVRLDAAYEPLARARTVALAASARVGFGRILCRIEDIAEGVEMLVAALDTVTPDHSPLDWARLQYALAHALQALGEGSEADRAFEHALSCYQRALWVTREQPALALRALLSHDQARCLARRAELAAEPALLEEAILYLLQDLQKLHPNRDPVGWAIAQVNLAQLYIARLDLDGGDRERAAAALALASAIEVFGEHGLRSLIDQASAALESLEARPRPIF